MKKLLYILPFVFLAACGDTAGKDSAEILDFTSEKEKYSYAIGVENAKGLLNSNPRFDMLDTDKLVKGFNENLSLEQPTDCEITLQNLLGPYGQDLDTNYVAEGSACIGRVTASKFFFGMTQMDIVEDVDLEMVKKGFEHGLLGSDTTYMNSSERIAAIDEFNKIIDERMKAEQEELIRKNIAAAPAWWEEVKKKNGVRQIGSTGIYCETIEPGSGGKPDVTSDIDVHYVLTNALGDTLESSIMMGRPLKMNLGQLIPGWKESFPSLNKGGIYRIYIPSEKAYQSGPLAFYIEFNDFGAAGTLAPPPPPQQPMF